MNKIKYDSKPMSKIGNYTKNAIKSFENNIVKETNYLEKVEMKLKDDKKL